MRLARALLLSAALCLPVATGQAQVDERAMKAAFLYNFAVFTQWPVSPPHAFALCVLGRTALDEALAGLEGRQVRDGALLSVRHVGTDEQLTDCQLLYIDERQRRDLDGLLTRLAGLPVLTVTDAEGLADRGIMIEMRKQGQRLAFDVNLTAARRVQLEFSARLLKLAAFVVHGS